MLNNQWPTFFETYDSSYYYIVTSWHVGHIEFFHNMSAALVMPKLSKPKPISLSLHFFKNYVK